MDEPVTCNQTPVLLPQRGRGAARGIAPLQAKELVVMSTAVLVATRAATTPTICCLLALRWGAQLRRLLYLDPLNGLGNRAALHREFRRTLTGPGRCVGVVMLDLDAFKSINDMYGHRFGDLVLTEVACLLRRHALPGQVPVRLARDEFAIWLGGVPDTLRHGRALEAEAHRLAAVFDEPIHIAEQQVTVPASAGVGIASAHRARRAARAG